MNLRTQNEQARKKFEMSIIREINDFERETGLTVVNLLPQRNGKDEITNIVTDMNFYIFSEIE